MSPSTERSAEDLVDLERYPVLDAEGPGWRQVVGRARADLAAQGAAELTHFVTPEGVAALVEDAEALAVRAHHSSGQGTAYLEIPASPWLRIILGSPGVSTRWARLATT